MSDPARGGLRSIAAPESIGALLAAGLVVGLVLTGALPGLGGGDTGTSSPSPSASTSAAPVGGGLDPSTGNALAAALAVNQRLAGHVEELQAAIDAQERTGHTISGIVRTMNQEARAGSSAAAPIRRDPATAVLGDDLDAFYAELLGRGLESQKLSVQEGAAYRAAAAELLVVLEQLPALNDRIADALGGRATASGGVVSPAPSPSASAIPVPSPSPSASPVPSAASSEGPSAAPSGPNLLANGTFDSDLAGWALVVAAGASASAAHDPAAGPDGSGAARIDIATGSLARSGITFVSSPFQLERGRRYRVTAYVRSTADREVRLRIAPADGPTTTARGFTVGASWTPLAFDLVDLTGGSASVFALDVGRGEEPVWLDRVTVVAIGG